MRKIILPGLIDIHVHLRDPGQTDKEDFYTGTSAALAGGFTTVFDMPNNLTPTITETVLNNKMGLAKKKAVCDIGFYFGSTGDNINEFKKINPPAGGKVFGLKLFLNPTTGNLLINEVNLEKVYQNWKGLILVHAEDEKVNLVLKMVKKYKRKTHFCHMSSIEELKPVIAAKKKGLPVTIGVTPHHLFLTEDDVKTLGPFGLMKPVLKSKKDQQYLWQNLNYIDVIESDHAPHTIKEKQSDKPAYGVPGLETTLPLLLKAEAEKRITLKKILDLCFYNPAKILKIKTHKRTKIEIEDIEYIIDNKDLKTKCRWSPFAGWKVRGRVKRVFIRGRKVYEDGKILVTSGCCRIIVPKR
jgi:carbamoyl-phosphate synthase/aspartate carbamoyltransferase/dihydroorotase